jgi:hypothetical protein
MAWYPVRAFDSLWVSPIDVVLSCTDPNEGLDGLEAASLELIPRPLGDGTDLGRFKIALRAFETVISIQVAFRDRSARIPLKQIASTRVWSGKLSIQY